MFRLHALLSVVAVTAILVSAVSAPAQTIINEWSDVKAPPAPELKTVRIEPKTTALLMLDFVRQTCNEQRRPRCLVTLSKAEKLLAEARAKDMLVVYSIVSSATISDTATLLTGPAWSGQRVVELGSMVTADEVAEQLGEVGDQEQPLRHLNAEGSRRLQVDDELEFGRLRWPANGDAG